MSIIQVQCVDQTLQIVNSPRIASGGIKEDSIKVEFCPLWDGFAKTAIFFNARDTVYYVVLDDAGCGVIPWEVMQNAGKMYFGIFGTKDGVTRTSEILTYQIVEGAITQNTIQPTEPTPTQYAQMVELVAGKAPVASPAFTGTPTAPTAATGTNSRQIATTAFVATAIAALVDSAPETLDTLEELAEALGNDPNFATTITNLISQKAAQTDLTSHTEDTTVHVTASEREAWAEHAEDTTVHVTASEREAWNANTEDTTAHIEDTTAHITAAERTEWNNHKADTTVHITAAERTAWNAKQKKIVVGTTDPEEMTGLEVGDIYIYLEE